MGRQGPATTSIHFRVAEARERLKAAGITPDEADLDARFLAEHVLGWDGARFFSAAADPEPPGFMARYEELIARRAAREPMAYIIGATEFWNLSFEVSPAVLIPRPESELIVELALGSTSARAVTVAADVCTGSGCLAVALARERPMMSIVATDISEPALVVARRNASLHRVASRIQFERTNLLDDVDGTFDLIVSNPPYVCDGDYPSLPPEVRDHEPPVALLAGADGLETIRRLVEMAPARLSPTGQLVFEIGFGQAEDAAALVNATPGLSLVEIRPDLQGIPRTVVARRRRGD